jgi:Na+-driven multidrug efflux pump
VLNFIFTPLLVFGIGPFPRLEIYGAGIGTSIAQIFGSIIAFAILHYKFERIELKLKYFRLRFDIFRRITKLGMPASLQLIAVSITSMGLAANANIFGTEILSTYIIGLKIDLFVSMVIFAMGASLEVITGQNIGAGKPERVYLYHISAIKQLTVLLGTLGVLVFFFGKYVGYIFVNDEFIISELDKYLKFAAFSYIPFSIGIASIRVISGAGDYFRSLVIVTIALICVQLPSAYIISNLTNNQMGIWFSMVMAIIFFAIIGFREVKRGKWLGKNV